MLKKLIEYYNFKNFYLIEERSELYNDGKKILVDEFNQFYYANDTFDNKIRIWIKWINFLKLEDWGDNKNKDKKEVNIKLNFETKTEDYDEKTDINYYLKDMNKESQVISKKKISYKEFLDWLLNKFKTQQEVAYLISKQIYSYIFLNNKRAPLNLFFFWKPGTWKTYMWEELTELINNYVLDKFAFQKINCTELQNDIWISKLIWTTKWYAGYNEDIDFFETLVNNDNVILLFDEIEKANIKIFKLLLNFMNKWNISSLDERYYVTMKYDDKYKQYKENKNKKTNYLKNVIIIFTSNSIKDIQEIYDFLKKYK